MNLGELGEYLDFAPRTPEKTKPGPIEGTVEKGWTFTDGNWIQDFTRSMMQN